MVPDPGKPDLFQSSVIHLCQWSSAKFAHTTSNLLNQTTDLVGSIEFRALYRGLQGLHGHSHSLLWNVTHLRYSCGSRAAGSQSSVFRSNQEMRAGLGPAHPGEGEPVRGLASGDAKKKQKQYAEALPPPLTSSSQVRTLGSLPPLYPALKLHHPLSRLGRASPSAPRRP